MSTPSRIIAVTDQLEYDHKKVSFHAKDQVTILAIYVTVSGSYVYFNIDPERVWWFVPGTRVHVVSKKNYRKWKFFFGKFTAYDVMALLTKLPKRDEMFKIDTDLSETTTVVSQGFAVSGSLGQHPTVGRLIVEHDGWYRSKHLPTKFHRKKVSKECNKTLTTISRKTQIFGSLGVGDIRTRKRRLMDLSLKSQ